MEDLWYGTEMILDRSIAMLSCKEGQKQLRWIKEIVDHSE